MASQFIKRSVIVFGADGHADPEQLTRLATHFGLATWSTWEPGDAFPFFEQLVVTQRAPERWFRRAMPLQAALQLLDSTNPHYPF